MSEKRYVPDYPVSEPPERVVSLVPSMTESLFDLSVGDSLVGITNYCVHPADKVGAIEKVGGTKNPNVSRIIALKPDLVIVNREENRKEDVEAIQEADIPVWITYPKTVQNALNLLWDIMNIFNETSMSPRVRLIESTYDWLFGISESREEEAPCKVFAPIWWKPLMTFNRDTYLHDLLHVCGGINVFGDHAERYPKITLEDVEKAQPDVVLLPTEPYAFKDADIAHFAALNIPAAKDGKIYVVDGSYLTWHGTRVAYALNTIPAMLCP